MDVHHCLSKIDAIVRQDAGSRRSCFQLGYNLGRLAELAGLGRDEAWDRWKEPVSSWDQPTLIELVEELGRSVSTKLSEPATAAGPPAEGPDGPDRACGADSGARPCASEAHLPN